MRSDDLEILALKDPVTTASLKKRYYELAMTVHPDRGGDPAAFAELSAAYERLMVDAAKREAVCPECNGRGVVEERAGFAVVRKACPRCKLVRKP